MRWLLIGLTGLALASCSKSPDSSAGEPDVVGNAAAGVAFTYDYYLTLPSQRIADLQEEHAKECEHLGVARCRITGLRYTVGDPGDVSASLSVKVAAPIARAFGREGVKMGERAGARLTGADISGTDVGSAAGATAIQRQDVAAERTRIAQQLARTDLPAAERAELLRQQAALSEQARTVRADATAQQDSLADTPMTFTYRTGRGTGFVDRLRDAGDTALGSIAVTITAILWVLAALGPPAVAILLLVLLWRRWGRVWWRKLVDRADRAPPPLAAD